MTDHARCPGCMSSVPIAPGATTLTCTTCRREFEIDPQRDRMTSRDRMRRRALIARRAEVLAERREGADEQGDDDVLETED